MRPILNPPISRARSKADHNKERLSSFRLVCLRETRRSLGVGREKAFAQRRGLQKRSLPLEPAFMTTFTA